MQSVLNAALPIFALILAGYLCAIRGILRPEAVTHLNDFVVRLALPALLFQSMAQVSWAQIDHPGFLAAFGGGMAATFGLCFALDRRGGTRREHHPINRRSRSDKHARQNKEPELFSDPDRSEKALADRTIEGLGAAYANTGFMGIPLCLATFGPAGLPAAVIATLLTACVLFAAAIVLIEADLGRSGGGRGAAWRGAGRVGLSLARNPLVAAPLLGLLWAWLGPALPGPVLRFTTLLGAAASPCALVTIGLFLARRQAGGRPRVVGRLVGLKLLLHPALTAALAFWVFPMPPLWSHAAILLSALPIGTGPFMLAELYGREAAVTSRAILVSTVLSVVTVSALVAWLGAV
jgi:malonate transporter